MKGTRLRRWTMSLAIGCGLASVFSVQLAGPASGQYFQPAGGNVFNNFTYGPGTFSGFGFPGFGGVFFPAGTQYLGTLTTVTTVGANPPTVTSQPVFGPVFGQPSYSQPAYSSGYLPPYPGYRGVYGDPYGYTTSAPYTQAAGPEQQQQEQQQAVQSPGVVVMQQQQQQQQSGGTGYGWGGGSNQQQQQQQQHVS